MPPEHLDSILLIETGGTHTRCGIAHPDVAPHHIALFDNADHEDLSSIVATYLSGLVETTPQRAALAVAAPPDENVIELTNLGWTVDRDGLRKQFEWSDIVVVNDFEALACAIPALMPDELFSIQAAASRAGAPLAVLGPGTGLGVSGLIPCGDGWFPLSGEGGHVTLAASDDAEADILRRLRLEYRHVSAERVLSGPGLLTLYRMLAEDPKAQSPLQVTNLANSGDEDALHALDFFLGFLGGVAGDLALTLGARGGVYLGGGILPSLRGHLVKSRFNRKFTDKGRFSEYMEKIPVFLITADTPALRGLTLHPQVQVLLNKPVKP